MAKISLVKRFQLAGPLIQAPMAGGPTTPELVAAVSNAGALGSFGFAYTAPDQIVMAIQRTKQLTARPFGVNLFLPHEPFQLDPATVEAALSATREFRNELGLPTPTIEPPFAPDFNQQVEAVLRDPPAVLSFTFGLPKKEPVDECRRRGIFTIGTATNVTDALSLEALGLDAVVAQGIEGGGHRGTFSANAPDTEIGILALTRLLATRLTIPVIAAGGIMDGSGIAAVMQLGADAAQLGTAFLACEESGISKTYRTALLRSGPKMTRVTRSFSGRLARGLENEFMHAMEGKPILPFPAQNTLTLDIRKKAAESGRPEFLSLWAGQAVDLIRPMKAHELVQMLFEEYRRALAN